MDGGRATALKGCPTLARPGLGSMKGCPDARVGWL
jgi:hypothetical protein